MFRLTADRTSASAARREVRTALASWSLRDEVCDDVVLVVSELVTNAIVHAAGDLVVCRLRCVGPEVRVEVASEGHGDPGGDDRAPGECGRGLVVVDALSTAWGFDVPTPGGGWTAWATIATHPAPASGTVPEPGRAAASGAAPGPADGTASGGAAMRAEVPR
ncbi:Histidine kinase-like ATPase domain-containing protein [Actinacidiphila yanglinensis]|uniref:Histidine kinase-like ATPase domain-containing protein n=1 Tax=Actinacidiphila yanglinensis TaxID=310779 RepID=A0A1H6B8C1_9ACTN|nr:ATP-binding protein [Actinacidiphila yanglinensis]SEG57083.1 Histidine kinase-like ATPase domain-containing protein [Actinacidiphila yanglinensis]